MASPGCSLIEQIDHGNLCCAETVETLYHPKASPFLPEGFDRAGNNRFPARYKI
jgi:hypothetical protein